LSNTFVDSRTIRNKILDAFEKATLPTTTPEELKTLLNFVVVGGGPVACEIAAQLQGIFLLSFSLSLFLSFSFSVSLSFSLFLSLSLSLSLSYLLKTAVFSIFTLSNISSS
jgi:hypothetical protein